jgi:hypothetical protein
LFRTQYIPLKWKYSISEYINFLESRIPLNVE